MDKARAFRLLSINILTFSIFSYMDFESSNFKIRLALA
jgi:hypothetical protein